MNNCKHCNKPTQNREYCSRDCKNEAQRIYTDETRLFVAENISRFPLRMIAQRIGVGYGGLSRQISKWRSEGYCIGGNKYEHYSR